MTSLLCGLAFALAAATGGAASDGSVGDGDPIFTRDEPNLAAGRRAMNADDTDTALERFRRATTTTDDQRAVVEYDVGQALTMRALATARAQAQAAREQAAADANGAPAPDAAPATPPAVDDALAALERAATLGRDPRLVSEARLAAGNAALIGGKIDDAIAQLRKAIVADPGNDRARRNLQRALTMKQQQPPPPPQDGDSDTQDGDKKDGDNKDKADQGDKKDDDNGDDDKQDQGQPKDQGDKGDDPADGQAAKPKPKPTTKEEAQRLLQGIRSRERPLSPLEMRGEDRQPPAVGKDW